MYFKCISYFQLSIILCSVLKVKPCSMLKGETYISGVFDDVVQLNVCLFLVLKCVFQINLMMWYN